MGSESGYSSGTNTQSECPSPETSSAWWQYKGAWEGGRTGLWERWGTGLWEGRWNSLAGRTRRQQGTPSDGGREGLAEGWERRKHEIKRPIQESTGREGTPSEEGEQHGQPRHSQDEEQPHPHQPQQVQEVEDLDLDRASPRADP